LDINWDIFEPSHKGRLILYTVYRNGVVADLCTRYLEWNGRASAILGLK
jgi:hypothetical protein